MMMMLSRLTEMMGAPNRRVTLWPRWRLRKPKHRGLYLRSQPNLWYSTPQPGDGRPGPRHESEAECPHPGSSLVTGGLGGGMNNPGTNACAPEASLSPSSSRYTVVGRGTIGKTREQMRRELGEDEPATIFIVATRASAGVLQRRRGKGRRG